jgi:hypothetical protein
VTLVCAEILDRWHSTVTAEHEYTVEYAEFQVTRQYVPFLHMAARSTLLSRMSKQYASDKSLIYDCLARGGR